MQARLPAIFQAHSVDVHPVPQYSNGNLTIEMNVNLDAVSERLDGVPVTVFDLTV